jgi:RHS repeat-associated protein
VDEVGELCWKAQLDVYGVARVEVGTTSCPWRWPGQYEDEETGLYYNRFRYYDPETGRYISQDPIGLKGGLALYQYVGDPLFGLDPLGLSDWKFNPLKDLDWRGSGHSLSEMLDEAFRRTGLPREAFGITQWQLNKYGKTVPVEWTAPGGAGVNIDDPIMIPTGEGPQVPHVGFQTAGKRGAGGASRGHILADEVPASRSSLKDKKACK